MKKKVNDLLLKMQAGKNCIGETANELCGLFDVSGSAIEIIKYMADCPYTIDKASVPKGGIAKAPSQVVGNMSLAYVKYERLQEVAEHYR